MRARRRRASAAVFVLGNWFSSAATASSDGNTSLRVMLRSVCSACCSAGSCCRERQLALMRKGTDARPTNAIAMEIRSKRCLAKTLKTDLSVYSRAGITCAEFGNVAFRQRVHELTVEVVVTRSDFRSHALIIHLARTINVFAQPVVKIVFDSSLGDFLLVVQLDLRDQQSREAARVLVQAALFVTGNFHRQFRVLTKTSSRRRSRSCFNWSRGPYRSFFAEAMRR